MQQLSTIDSLLIVFYFIFILFLGFRKISNTPKSTESFLLGGRTLTLPAFVATLVSTWYGGILGVGEFSYLYGISSWLVFGVPYYLTALLFAFFLGKRAQRKKVLTIPHQLEDTYGKNASLVGALFVFFMTSPAPYILMLGMLLHYFLNWPIWMCISAGAILSLVYVLKGGFSAVVRTDKLQFLLMFSGFIFIVIFAAIKYGGWHFLQANCPPTHFEWHGGNNPAFIIVWFFIAMQTLVEPTFYQRCFAAKSEQTAKYGLLISIAFWLVFDFLTTTAGLYARALLPDLTNPATSYLDLADKVLPPFVLGLFIIGLISTIMSTVDSYTFISGMTIGRDFLWRIRQADEDKITTYTQIGVVITSLLSIFLAIYGKSIISLWKNLGSIATPALLLPVLGSYYAKLKMRSAYAITAMLAGGGSAALWMLMRNISSSSLFQIEAIYIGLISAVLVFLFDKITR